jgi:4-carboxymuconolactone decarboxylase
MDDELFETGLEIRREVLGREYVDASLASADEFSEDFQRLAAEFKLHLRGAITNGCTREEIKDALIQLTIYAGVPAGVEAFRNAREVFAQLDADQPA